MAGVRTQANDQPSKKIESPVQSLIRQPIQELQRLIVRLTQCQISLSQPYSALVKIQTNISGEILRLSHQNITVVLMAL